MKSFKCHDCSAARGGTPLCGLPLILDPKTSRPYVRNVHIEGASAAECMNKRRDDIERQFDIMFIGEAPGGTEDDMLMPFVGDAGDILMEFISKSGLDPDKIYLTNVLKCRPPKGRKPAREELKKCRIHIEHEIKTINPKIIVLLGKTSANLFRIQGAMGTVHGQLFKLKFPDWEESPEFLVVPTWHPAAFLHKGNPLFKTRALDDYVYVKNLYIDGAAAKPFYRAEYQVADTVEKVKEVVDYLSTKSIFSFDTESRGLGLIKEPMIMIQLSRGKGKTWIIPFYRHDPDSIGEWKLRPQWSNEEREEVCNQLKRLFENENIEKIAHNIKYDLNILKQHCDIDIKGFLWDTFLIHHLLEAVSPHKLETIGDMEFGTGDWGQEKDEYVGTGKDKKPYDLIPDEVFWQYAATDAEVTFSLFSEKLYDRFIRKKNLVDLYLEETAPAIRALAKGEKEGNKLYKDKILLLKEEYDKEIDLITAKCREYTKPDFNPGSTDQVREALLALGFSDKISKPEKPSGYSTSKEILTDISGEHDLIQQVLNYRSVSKLRSTYVNRALSDMDDDGRIRISFNIGGTVSGRLSCSFLHQIPRIDKKRYNLDKVILRDIFGEEDDFYYFYADYSQIELRVFAVLTQEQAFLDLLADPDADFHSLTAAGALGIDVSNVNEFNRSNIGKPMNFGIIYGSEGHALAKAVYEDPFTGERKVLGFNRSKEVVRTFHQTYKMVKEYLDDVEVTANAAGNKLTTVFGRELQFPELASPNQYVRGEAKRAAVNFTVQSPANSIALRTIVLVDRWMEENKITTKEVRFLNTVHDSIAYGVRKDLISDFSSNFKRIAERPIPQLKDYSFLVKMGWADSWTKAEMAT